MGLTVNVHKKTCFTFETIDLHVTFLSMKQKRKTLTFREKKLPSDKIRQVKVPREKTYRKHLLVKLRTNVFLVEFPGTLAGNYQL